MPDSAGVTSGRKRPAGAEQRILRAAGHLFAERGYRSVTVRDIAAEAGVAHPLVHYYFGSKRDLLAAVLKDNQMRMRVVASRGREPRTMVFDLARENLAGSRDYLLTLTRTFVEGMPVSEWPGGFPAIEAILDRLDAGPGAGSEADDVRCLVAVIVAMLTGWVLIEDQLLEIVGLEPRDRERAREVMLRSIEHVLSSRLPSD